MARSSNDNSCTRCPGYGNIRIDGPLTLRLCQRCWLEWKAARVRLTVLNRIEGWLVVGYEEAAPRNIREEE